MAIAFLATIAAQMGAAWLNSSRGKANNEKLAELQRAYEERITLEGIENARIEFAELCAFQRDMEKQSQLDRLALIRDNHEQILLTDAYENSLHNWPLLVPPYVIANAPLIIGASESSIIPLNCILTTSSDLSFNNNVFHKLEEQIALFCSKYWNVSANKSIRFFQEAWRDEAQDIGSRHKDIYAHLKNVPTLLISPILKNNTLLFRFYWWGLSTDPADAHINDLNELNPELSVVITPNMKYNNEEIDLIVNECVPKLEAFISFFADLYYWNFYKETPSLIKLISNKVIKLSTEVSKQYISEYCNRVIDCLEQSKFSKIDADLIVETTKEIFNNHENELVNKIHSCVIENKNLLHSFNIPMIEELARIDSDYSDELLQLSSNLAKDETITVHPFSNSDEMFYNAKILFDFPSVKDKRCHILFINEFAFICSITDINGCNLYSNPTSRFHLFITHKPMPFAEYQAGELDLTNQNFFKNASSSSPCAKLSYDKDNMSELIEKVRGFLRQGQDIYNQISSIIPTQMSNNDIHETITFDNIKRWIRNNITTENEFRLVLAYNPNNRLYALLGRFFVNGEMIENKAYIDFFRFIDDSIKDLLKYNCVIKLNIN